MIADDRLHIVDLNMDWVLVDTVDNPQMKLYALGALESMTTCTYKKCL